MKKTEATAKLTMYEILDAAREVAEKEGLRLKWEGKGESHDFTDPEAWKANEKLASALNKEISKAG